MSPLELWHNTCKSKSDYSRLKETGIKLISKDKYNKGRLQDFSPTAKIHIHNEKWEEIRKVSTTTKFTCVIREINTNLKIEEL